MVYGNVNAITRDHNANHNPQGNAFGLSCGNGNVNGPIDCGGGNNNNPNNHEDNGNGAGQQ
jgi:hypothetical protein